MPSVSATCLRFQPLLSLSNRNSLQATRSKLGLIGWARNTGCPSVKAFRVSCAAKPETVQKVSDIVRKQLALAAETKLTPESKFSALGADSLDTVEIVMELEEEFGISVEEENSQNITTIQEAADVIEQLVEKKSAQAAN